MDERIKLGLQKIYSELFTIILLLAAVSAVVKVLFLEQPLSNTLFEYVVMVGSPIYLTARRRMLKLDMVFPPDYPKTILMKILILGAALAVLTAASFAVRSGGVDLPGSLLSIGSFLVTFGGVSFLSYYLQKRRNRKMEEDDQ